MKGIEPGKAVPTQGSLYCATPAQVWDVFLFRPLWEKHQQLIPKGADLKNHY